MKGDQMGILAAYPTQRELPLSNQTRFNVLCRSNYTCCTAMPDQSLLSSIRQVAADPGYFTGLHKRLVERGIVAAVQAHNIPALFRWLVEILSLQGISDA